MIHLNDTNGASFHTYEVVKKVMNEFVGEITGCEMGIAYGGGVEAIGKLWKDRGIVYGFDTFEGHPKQVADSCEYTKQAGGAGALATWCMDQWYNNPAYGTDAIKYEYIREQLDKQGLDNVILVKGLITDKTKLPFNKLNYCFLDLDFPLSMWQAYNLVKDKIVKGGYLCLHDVLPHGHIPGCWEYYHQMLSEGLFEIHKEVPECLLAILKKIK